MYTVRAYFYPFFFFILFYLLVFLVLCTSVGGTVPRGGLPCVGVSLCVDVRLCRVSSCAWPVCDALVSRDRACGV